jgi:general L-amino acid transport system permease protein
MTENVTYVRQQFLAQQPPPASANTALAWIRRNLFASITDSILSIVAIVITVWFVISSLDFLLFQAVWTGADRTVCATAAQGGVQPDGWKGACWANIGDWSTQFLVGSYPRDQLWRPIVVALLFVGLLIPFLMPKAPRKGLNAILLLIGLPIVAYVLLLGGMFGLSHVETSLWAG